MATNFNVNLPFCKATLLLSKKKRPHKLYRFFAGGNLPKNTFIKEINWQVHLFIWLLHSTCQFHQHFKITFFEWKWNISSFSVLKLWICTFWLLAKKLLLIFLVKLGHTKSHLLTIGHFCNVELFLHQNGSLSK